MKPTRINKDTKLLKETWASISVGCGETNARTVPLGAAHIYLSVLSPYPYRLPSPLLPPPPISLENEMSTIIVKLKTHSILDKTINGLLFSSRPDDDLWLFFFLHNIHYIILSRFTSASWNSSKIKLIQSLFFLQFNRFALCFYWKFAKFLPSARHFVALSFMIASFLLKNRKKNFYRQESMVRKMTHRRANKKKTLTLPSLQPQSWDLDRSHATTSASPN